MAVSERRTMKDRRKGSVPGRADKATGTAKGPTTSDHGGTSPPVDCPVLDLASARARRAQGGSNEVERGNLLLGLAYLATLRGEHFLDQRERT
jgi:hypothetical protein